MISDDSGRPHSRPTVTPPTPEETASAISDVTVLRSTIQPSATSTQAGSPNQRPAELSPGDFVFNISNSSNRKVLRLTFSPEKIDQITRKSLVFQKLIDTAASRTIDLNINTEFGFKNEDVGSVLQILSEREVDVKTDPRTNPESNLETIALQCAILWFYECDPKLSTNIGNGEELQWMSSFLSTDHHIEDSRVERPEVESNLLDIKQEDNDQKSQDSILPRGNISHKDCGYLTTIGLVLGSEKMLKDEIKHAVWGTGISVEVEKSLLSLMSVQEARYTELKWLFHDVKEQISEIESKNKDEKFPKLITATLLENGIGDFSRGWKANAERIMREGWTPFRFLYELEKALRLELQKESGNRKQLNVELGLDVPYMNWTNLFSKLGIKFKKPRKEKGMSYQDMKDGILRNLQESIDMRCDYIVHKKVMERMRIMDGWKGDLRVVATESLGGGTTSS